MRLGLSPKVRGRLIVNNATTINAIGQNYARFPCQIAAVFRKLNILTKRDWLVICIGLCVLVALQLRASPSVDRPALSDADAAYVKWDRNANGAGAFARGSDGAYGHTNGYNTVAAAQAAALAYCHSKSAHCRIVKTRNDAVQIDGVDMPLAPRGQHALKFFLTRQGFKAFAASPNGAVGYAYQHTSTIAAKQEALRTCNKFSKQGLPSYVPAAPCRVIFRR